MEAANITRDDREPARRRDPEGSQPAGRSACCARRRRTSPSRALERGDRRRRRAEARRRRAPADSSWPCRPASRRASPSFQDAGESFATIDVLKQARRRRRARHPAVGDGARQQRQPRARSCRSTRRSACNDNHLTIAAIKIVADGALGSRGAWMLEPYSDFAVERRPADNAAGEHCGDWRRIALDNGVQLCVHAIGDRANREVLNIYERAFKARPDREGLALAHRARAAHRAPPTSRASASSA